jgi:hypothetical protein
MNNIQRSFDVEDNRDPITDAPGSHPVGTGIGAVLGGAAAGAATGTVAGPVGTVIGAALGAVVGGLAGKGVAEAIDPTAEEAYWRENHKHRPYADGDAHFEDYQPAHGFGVASYSQYEGRRFEDVEPHLSRDWDSARGKSRLDWNDAKAATRDAWDRVSNAVERAVPGDSDRDGR